MRRTTRRTFLVLTAAALGAVAAASGFAGDEPAPPPGPRIGANVAPFVVHEWGTFTSMHGASGAVLEGLSREEEALPAFVYDRAKIRDCPLRDKGWKGLEMPAEHVTRKMETPVIYFHSAEPRRVRARVDFVKGLLTQWYPVSDLLGPPEGGCDAAPLDLRKVERSFLEWEVDVLPKGGKGRPAQVPAVADGDPWAFAREVDASWVRTAPRKSPEREGPVEAERYLFYRGLGTFPLPLTARMWIDDAVVLHNSGDEPIDGAIVFEIRGERGRMTTTDPIAPGSAVKAILRDGEWWGPADDVARKLEALVHERLVKLGLFEDEAAAMVRTWARSWFRSEGLRALWFCPRKTVDAILPLAIDPAPDALVRVLVGRTEVIPPKEAEADFAALLDLASDVPEREIRGGAVLRSRGRFAEPHLRNVLGEIERRAEQKIARPDDEVVRKQAETWLGKILASAGHGEGVEVFPR